MPMPTAECFQFRAAGNESKVDQTGTEVDGKKDPEAAGYAPFVESGPSATPNSVEEFENTLAGALERRRATTQAAAQKSLQLHRNF
jgi:hypothetical protein